MNLGVIAGSVISAVNPDTPVTLQISTGWTQNADFTRVPKYAQPAIPLLAQVQELTEAELHQIDGLNLQGLKIAIYLGIQIDGAVRSENKGGDLVNISTGPRAGVYLVSAVLEQWNGDFCKVAAVLQNGS